MSRCAFESFSLVSLALACWLVATGASAQEAAACEEGRVTVSGRCCWPGQAFDAERGVCAGEPRCPAGLAAHGDSCVPRVAPSGAQPTQQQQGPAGPWGSSFGSAPAPGAMPRVYGETTEEWPEEPPADRVVRRAAIGRGEDEGLITFALAMYDIGYVFGWIGGWIELSGNKCQDFTSPTFERVNCDSWPIAGVPVVGGLLASSLSLNGNRQDSLALVFGITSLIFELTGAVSAIIAFANETTEEIYGPPIDDDEVQVSFLPAAAGSEAGVSMLVTF